MSDLTLFRVSFKLTAPLGTPLNSGTMFGQLCWRKREAEGEAALVAWLTDEAHVWALSDGFPGGLLPRPLLAPQPRSDDPRAADTHKQNKKKQFVTREGFLKNRNALTPAKLDEHLRGVKERSATVTHNTIDRRTGSTPEEGGLYFLDEDWSFSPLVGSHAPNSSFVEAGPSRDVYVEAPRGDETRIKKLFQAMGEAGFGRDASLGRGLWNEVRVKEDRELAAKPQGKALRYVSLSHGVADGFVDMRCKLAAHYGKTGPQVAVADGVTPFKRPLLLAQPGATFAKANGARPGTIINGVHMLRPEIIHNGLHVAIPYNEVPS